MKKLLSRRPVCILLIFAIVFGVYGIILAAAGDRHTVYVNFSPNYECRNVSARFGDDFSLDESEIMTVEKVNIFDDYATVTLRADKKGSQKLELIAELYENGKKTGESAKIENIRIGAFNVIYNNIYQQIYIVLSALSLLILLYYIYCFVQAVRTKPFSYETLFFLSVALMVAFILAIWSSATVYSYTQYHTASSILIYSVNQNLMLMMMLATLPLIAVFILSVSVSNIRLMTREGFRPANALGIITSIMMLAGVAVLLIAFNYKNNYDASTFFSVAYSVLSSLYVFFFILLVSAIIYGIYASKHTPKYDKDYIIILGCKIKDDGTLYPLVRGRVDKAIEFYKKQLEKTGKAAYFVPSGGQGSDEIIAEGEAMKRYLIEQGIPEDRILAETKSTTTRENMLFSKAIIDEKNKDAKILFSTTSYHVFRSGAIAYANGINIDGIGAKTKWYFWPNAFLREVAGIYTTQPKKQIIITAVIALAAGLGSFVYSLFSN